MGLEANFAKGFEVEDVAAVEDKGWLEHFVVDRLEVEFSELVPLSENGYGVGVVTGFGRRGVSVNSGMVFGNADVGTDLFVGNLGVVNVDLGLFVEEIAADVNGRRFPGIVGVFLEGESEDGC